MVTGAFEGGAFLAALPYTLLAVVAVLGTTFAIARAVGKHAVVDVAWGLGFVVVAFTAFLVSAGDGDAVRRTVVLVLVAAWGIRLGTHIALRSRGKGEDPRYEDLMKKASGNPHLHAFTRIYLTQGALMWFISLPVQVAMFQTEGLGVVAAIGILVWAVGLFFEAVGDWQLTRFRNDPSNKGEVLDTGLWRYTRHPNYFGDATAWWGMSLVAFEVWPGLLTVLSPVVMTYLLARGSGKPLLERDIEERRPGYADYVRRTSGFVPLPPRRS